MSKGKGKGNVSHKAGGSIPGASGKWTDSGRGNKWDEKEEKGLGKGKGKKKTLHRVEVSISGSWQMKR